MFRLSRAFSTAASNYYDVLGVTQNATIDQIKSAYRGLAKQYHPDMVSADDERFRMITEAYSVLVNLETRVRYDMTRQSMSVSEVEKILNRAREKDGLMKHADLYQPHEYGYERLKELAAQRKKYNIDKFNKYRGGVPQEEGINRGNAMGATGERAWFKDVDYAEQGVSDETMAYSSRRVDEMDADLYKIHKGADYKALAQKKPYLPAEVNYDWAKGTVAKKYVLFWGALGLLMLFPYIDKEAFKAYNRRYLKQLEGQGQVKVMQAVGWSAPFGSKYFSNA